jgi:hypothetical protein
MNFIHRTNSIQRFDLDLVVTVLEARFRCERHIPYVARSSPKARAAVDAKSDPI